MVAVLRRTPRALRQLLEGVSPTEAAAAPAGEWSAFDVVGHLIDGEETDWIPRARIILSGEADRRFTPFDRHRHLERNRGKALGALLDEFSTLRAANLDAKGQAGCWFQVQRELMRDRRARWIGPNDRARIEREMAGVCRD